MKIEFDAAAHRYTLDGRLVPSVTQCLQLLDPFQKVDRCILEANRQFGQHGHKAMALLVRERLDWKRLDPSLLPYVEAGADFLHEWTRTQLIVASEEIVAQPVLGVAGTIDLVTEDERLTTVVEFKFTADHPATVGPQTEAYARLLRYCRPALDRKLIRRICVVLKERRYDVQVCQDPNDWSDFLSCLNVTKWRLRHGIE